MRGPASRNIVILGASSEIGRALAREAAKRVGYRVLLASRSFTNELTQYDKNHTQYIHGIDLTVEADLLRLQTAVRDFFVEPFSIVHSVGDFWIHEPLVKTKFSVIRGMYESHYLTLCGAAYFLLPTLIEKDGGQLVAFSCNSVMYNYPDMAPFTSAKAAVESLVKCLANEYAEHGIAVNALALPTIKTERVLIEKPRGDHANYLSPEDLVEFLLENVLTLPASVNGSVFKVFKYSPTFYHSGYFERNPRHSAI